GGLLLGPLPERVGLPVLGHHPVDSGNKTHLRCVANLAPWSIRQAPPGVFCTTENAAARPGDTPDGPRVQTSPVRCCLLMRYFSPPGRSGTRGIATSPLIVENTGLTV